MFSRRHHSIDQVIKSRGANKLLVDNSVYSFKKDAIRQGNNSVSINAKKLAPLNDRELMKAMLTQTFWGRDKAWNNLMSHRES